MSELDNMWQDPGNWKWGLVYFNPKDRRVFVLKRIPAMGITLNFAHPAAYLITMLIFIAAALVIRLPAGH